MARYKYRDLRLVCPNEDVTEHWMRVFKETPWDFDSIVRFAMEGFRPPEKGDLPHFMTDVILCHTLGFQHCKYWG